MKTVQYNLQPKQWIAVPVKKQYVVWHGTGKRTIHSPYAGVPGTATQLIESWNNDGEKFAAPYVIERSGTVYQAFPDTEWAYHLNIPGSKGHYDKQSVAIEVANELALIRENSVNYINGRVYHQNMYSGPFFKKSFRGEDYWADMEKAQLDSLIELTLQVCDTHKIKPKLYLGDDFNPRVWEKATIFRHLNCGRDKLDFPLNDWVVEKLKEKFELVN